MKKNIFIAVLIALLLISTSGWLFTYLGVYLLSAHVAEMDHNLRFAEVNTIGALHNHYDSFYPKSVSIDSIKTDSPFDRINISHTKLIALNIIQLLKDKTGDDLGDDPKAWIDKYGENRNR